MKYIDLINNFWNFYDENNESINTSDISLYFVLLRYCNKIFWKNPFFVELTIMNELSPLSINTYYKSLDNLHNLKLIEYKKGKHNRNKAKITILKIKNSTMNSIVNSIANSNVNSTMNSIVNNNKTINTNIQEDLIDNEILLKNLLSYEKNELPKDFEGIYNLIVENENIQNISLYLNLHSQIKQFLRIQIKKEIKAQDLKIIFENYYKSKSPKFRFKVQNLCDFENPQIFSQNWYEEIVPNGKNKRDYYKIEYKFDGKVTREDLRGFRISFRNQENIVDWIKLHGPDSTVLELDKNNIDYNYLEGLKWK